MRRRLVGSILVLLGLVAAGGIFSFNSFRWQGPWIDTTPTTFARLHEGMTRAEVEAILGGPPGHYGSDPYQQPIIWDSLGAIPGDRPIPDWYVPAVWYTDAGRIDVRFHDGGSEVRVWGLWRSDAMPPRPWAVRHAGFLAWTTLVLACWGVGWLRILFSGESQNADTTPIDTPASPRVVEGH
jgi:hypothetical protein